MSSFGYGGTIAHALVRHKFGDAQSTEAHAFGSRGAEAAGEGLTAENLYIANATSCSLSDRLAVQRLTYHHRVFPWRNMASSVDNIRALLYSMCWAPVLLSEASPPRMGLLLTTRKTPTDNVCNASA